MISFNIDKETALDLLFVSAMSAIASHPITLNEAKEMHRQMAEDRIKSKQASKDFEKYVRKVLKGRNND